MEELADQHSSEVNVVMPSNSSLRFLPGFLVFVVIPLSILFATIYLPHDHALDGVLLLVVTVMMFTAPIVCGFVGFKLSRRHAITGIFIGLIISGLCYTAGLHLAKSLV